MQPAPDAGVPARMPLLPAGPWELCLNPVPAMPRYGPPSLCSCEAQSQPQRLGKGPPQDRDARSWDRAPRGLHDASLVEHNLHLPSPKALFRPGWACGHESYPQG